MTAAPRSSPVTVAIPVRNGLPLLGEVLAAAADQRIDRQVELLVVDSGSTDGSAELARSKGARVIEIDPAEFSHGGTRNRIMEWAHGDQVAFLTQDATPADEHWLARLLSGFELAPNVGLSFGPYRPRPDASVAVARELDDYFASFSPSGEAVVQLVDEQSWKPAPGPLAFFSDANGCVARAAWEQVPYREVPYAEDQLLACDMLAAGYAKAYVPQAAVVHSHEYGPLDQLRRSFDEWRGLREVFGYKEPAGPRRHIHTIRREVRADRASGKAAGSLRHHSVRALGSVLGSRADRLPSPLRRSLSLERRGTFEPVSTQPDPSP